MTNQSDLKQLLNEITKQNSAPQKLLITANDQIRISQLLDNLISRYFPDASTISRYSALNWSNEIRQKIITDLQSPGLFTPSALVMLQNIEELNASELEKLSECLEYTSANTALWLIGKPLNKTSKFRKIFANSSTLVEFQDYTTVQYKTWLKKEASSCGLTDLSESVINAVYQITEGSLDQSIHILEHCALYSNNGKLSISDLNLLYPETPEENEFALLDLIHTGKPSQIFHKITKSLQAGKNAFMLLSLIAKSYSRYIAISSALSAGETIQNTRENLNMKEWTFKKHLEVVSKKPLARLHNDLEALLLADSKLKNRSLGEIDIFCELANKLKI